MDINSENNLVRLCGTPNARPVYSHSSRGQDFWTFPLRVQRLSGNYDTLNILARQEQLAPLIADGTASLCVTGELRSFNNRSGSGARLVITVLARELRSTDEDDANHIRLRGTLCRPPNLRFTPMGREICDLMLAVNRRYGRSDYIPCICWGQKARSAAGWTVGTRLALEGRIQSRDYIKLTEDGPLEKVAYEVSAAEVTQIE